MKVKSLAPWFGGKRTLAPKIIEHFRPDHAQYFEPFAASMAVLFAKPRSRHETVNDLHGDIVNLARVVADPELGPQLYDRLSLTLFSEDLFDRSREFLSQPIDRCDPVERAFNYFAESWMGRNGFCGTQRMRGNGFSLAVRWTSGGGSPTIRWRSAIESIPAWHERLQNVVILQRDAFDVIPKISDDRDTVIYVDPPYLAETRSGFTGSGAHSRYEHEFSNGGSSLFGERDDHERLAEELNRFQDAQVVVSYYYSDRLQELYPNWKLVDLTTRKNLQNQNAKNVKADSAPEVLLVNG